MGIPVTATRKIGSGLRLALAGALCVVAGVAWAAEPKLIVIPDRVQIGQDESLSLKLSIQSDGSKQASEPAFDAPDFEVLNQYQSSSTQMSTRLTPDGQFETETRQTTDITKVLRPLKAGKLKISGLKVVIGGRSYTHPDLVIDVGPAGAGTPPPRGYGGGGVGLRGAGKRVAGGNPVFLRAEVDKNRAYKGEQVIISYYLYHRTNVFNLDMSRFPPLNGFLREDLEIPIMSRRLEPERVIVEGVPYERSLIARYAAYPLQVGNLTVDSMALKYNYYANPGGALDNEDDPFMTFFRQLTPHPGQARSEPVKIEVIPVPEEGRTVAFTGGVGDFSVTAAVNKYEVRANEALTLTVKVEGRGNVSAISEPKPKWPDQLELYDTKGRSKTGKGGVGEKIFEFLLIPRAPGKLDLPGLEFSFFDPIRREYVTKSTEPVSITVHEPAPGSQVYVPPSKQPDAAQGTAAAPSGKKEEWLGLKPPTPATQSFLKVRQEGWHFLYWILSALLAIFTSLVGYDLIRRARASQMSAAESRSKTYAKSWERLRHSAKAAPNGASWPEVSQDYERLTGLIFDAIDGRFKVGARSMSRSELGETLVGQRGFPEASWRKVVELLEFAELVRFASSAGAVSEAKARAELGSWVKSGEELARELEGFARGK